MIFVNNIFFIVCYFIKQVALTASSIFRVIIFSRLPVELPKKKIANINNGAVLGSGPSLNAILVDIDLLNDMDKMCVNDIVLYDYFDTLKPQYYLLLDPAYFLENASEGYINLRETIIDALISKTTWKMVLFLPQHTRLSVWDNIQKRNENIKPVYFNATPVDGFKLVQHFLFKCNLGMPLPQNVLIAGIFLMLNMGYKKIFLMGADHSWHESITLDLQNRVCIKSSHCYSEESCKCTPFYKDVEQKDTFKVHELFEAWSIVFTGYHRLREYADYLNVKIFNLSVKSYIDAFDKMDLKKCVKK